MKNHFLLTFCLGLSACVGANQSTRGYQAIDLPQVQSSLEDAPLLVREFSDLCLSGERNAEQIVEHAALARWDTPSKAKLKEEGLGQLKKMTLVIPGGGAPIEETQSLLAKPFKDELFVLEIAQHFERKRLIASNCTLFGNQGEFLENCAGLGKLLNRAPVQNTRYKENKAHFISWNASLGQKQAKIRCITTPNSPTLPYKGTQMNVSVSHLAPAINTKKSNPQRFDVSGR